MELINQTVKADIDNVHIEDPDAPTAEEQAGTGSTIKYTVEKGTMNPDAFYDDETHWIKHYTYDNLHVIEYSLKTKNKLFKSYGKIEVASFNDLSSVPHSGSAMGFFHNRVFVFSIENNKVYV